MTRLLLGLALACLLSVPASAQTTTEAAKAEGKAFGKQLAPAAQSAATTAPDADRVPNFSAAPAQSPYFDDPDRMSGDAASQANSNPGYRTIRDSLASRAKFDAVDLDAVIARGQTISDNPLAYTSGMSVGGMQGRCVALPPAGSSAGRYSATCNTGYAIEDGSASCTIPLVASVTTISEHLYYCSESGMPRIPACTAFEGQGCLLTGSHEGRCLVQTSGPGGTYCSEPGEPVYEYTCPAPVAGYTPVNITTRQVVDTARDESQCTALAGDADCTQASETCSDSDPVTRSIGGVEVTQPCWAWRRDYRCTRFTPKQDCDALQTTPGCVLKQEYCLTEDEPCRSYERVYDCPLPQETTSASQFICDGDVYCIDGQCETIEREANDEFKDAVVALNAMDQARREFDPDTLTLFKGTRNTCSSKVFGVLNCCKGKGFSLIPGIQLLVALGCSREEVLLHERDAQGLCAYVGSYCSDSVLGVCLTKKKVYCCFESKLSRILQEQGRAQLPKPWAKPKAETCAGFTIEEFARLDLSRMDFSEVYAEFTAAAKLPDELEAANDIQQKIEAYYARTRP